MPIAPLRRTRRTALRLLFAATYALGTLGHVYLTLTDRTLYYAFADLALVETYRDIWTSFVVPNLAVLLPAVILFEAILAVTILWGGRVGRLGNLAGAVFQLALVPSGPWGVVNLVLAGGHLWLARQPLATTTRRRDVAPAT